MKKVVVILFVMLHILSYSCDERIHHRVKRKLLFTKNSKFFFRLNGKDNVVPWNQIFAHGWAFRINYDLPETLPRRRKFFKRETVDELENLNVMKGYSCIMKLVCQFVKKIKSSSKCGVFCRIGNLLTRLNGMDVEFFMEIFERCDYYKQDCPYTYQDSSYFIRTNTD